MSAENNERSAAVDVLRERLLRQRLGGTSRGDRPGITPVDRDAPLRLSHGQQQMWFLNRLEPGSPEYLVPFAFRIRGDLDVAALRRAWTELTTRHEILRTRYALDGAEPVQIVDDAVDAVQLPLTEHGRDAASAAASDAERWAAELVGQEAVTPFDVEQEWPARARLLRLAPDDHILTAVFHHIAFDAWSTRVLGSELSALYEAFRDGRPSPLAELPIQYADYAAWLRSEVSGKAMEGHLDYWRAQLADAAPVGLPADRPRPAFRSHDGAEVSFALSSRLTAAVRDIAGRHDTTPFVVLLSAFQALVARYTGQRDVPVGTTVSGRTQPQLQALIGYGINSLVLRGRWEDDPGFGELVSRARTTLIDAYDHQAVPFAQLVDELRPERDMSRTPLYQVALTMHQRGDGGLALPGLDVETYPMTSRIAKCDLELQINDAAEDRFEGQLVYATALFDQDTVERMARHFVRLLESAVDAPERPLSRLDILEEGERESLLGAGARDVPAAAVSRCVQELFEERVAAAPDAVAVVAGGQELTYAEVNRRANRLAHHLRSLGVGPESLVGLCLERGAELIPALLGVLKSGAGYVPLDPANPAERIGYVLADAGVEVAVSTAGLEGLLAEGGFGGEVVALDRDGAVLEGCSEANPEVLSGPDNAVYVIYTSGSTGRPKGVTLTHANVVRLMETAQEHYSFDATDVWSLFHSFAFDVSVFEMWGALLHGGTLVVVPQDVARSPEDFLDLLVEQRVTVLSQTPTAFRALVAAAGDGDPRIDRLALRHVVFAGEKLEFRELRPWTDRLGLDTPALVNMYGITETTVHTTFYRVTRSDLEAVAGNPVGEPLSDLRVHLLDDMGQLVPIGVPGEIHVAGPGVARGYLGRPGLTAERFVPDPFGPAGARLYRSGDLARRRPDGALDYLGRIDHQVKIRGYRVELGEIEAALTAHADVRQAVVVVREDTPGDKRLVAYVVPVHDGPVPGVSELRELLGRDLPDYMMPVAFVTLDALPLTTNGKLDKRALPAPGTDSFLQGVYVAPRTPLEERVAAVWATALETDRVGVHDSFFDLGGDSIRAVALVGALRAEGIDLSVRDVFDRRSVAELCELLTGRPALSDEAQTLVKPFELISAEDREQLPDSVVDAYPLSQIQTGMVIEMLADEGQNNYHNVSSFRIRDDRPFSAAAFEEAARTLVTRHEVLRTSLHLADYSVPMQLVHARADITVGVQDLSGLDADAAEAELRAFVARERATLFDLGTPSLMRFHAHVTADDGLWISATECHPILEGWSHHSMLMELLGCYRQLRDGEEPGAFEAPEVRFADSIAAELGSLASDEDRAYWRGVVDEYAKFTLPTGWGEDRSTPRRAHHVMVPWGDLESGLRALATRAGASLKSVMVAAHTKVMSQLTDAPAFHTGLVYDVRPEVLGADRVYGMYLNTLPFPVERSAGTWLDLVRQVFAREVTSWPHRRHPLPTIQRAVGGTQRLIDVFFNYQDFRQVDAALVDAAVGIDDSPTEFPLTVSSRNGHVFLTADSWSLSRAHAERIGAMYRAVLEAMAADPAADARTTFVAADELGRQLQEWAVNPAEPETRTVLDLFEEQAARTPDATAAVHGRTRMSYADLDDRANRYAHHLRSLGVGRESVVGVLLDRGTELVAALLGVWKAGAAYLPMDPAVPADRVAHMLTDARAAAVVTHSAYEDRLPESATTRRLFTDRDGFAIGSWPRTTPSRTTGPDDLAYVIYTSGSTGLPKGVLVPQRGLANHVRWAVDELAGEGTTGAPLFSSIAFDLVVPNLWAPLLAGQAVHLLPQDTELGELGEALAAAGPYSFVKLTPAHLEVLTHQLSAEQARALAPVLVVAGEALTRRVVRAWRHLAPQTRLVNEYGPTEASVGTCTFPVPQDAAADVMPIGRPLPNVTMYVLDERLQPLPVGVPGELYVGGAGVARGYLDRSALTADRFLPDPYGPAGTRLYRTGDVVRLLPDGDVEFLGRVDGQVKIHGYRIELGEIEAALSDHEQVADARVLVREDTTGDKQLVAYIVPAGGAAPAPGPLREALARSLPAYMVPSAFVELAAVPLTANGKLDRAALPVPGEDAFARAEFVAPRTVVEERVAAVWGRVLGVERVGVVDSFFDLGGDSIRAVALIGALRAEGLDVSVRDVFQRRTVAGLAESLTGRAVLSAQDEVFAEPFVLVPEEDRERLPEGLSDAYPLSRIQTGMLVETLADDAANNYHNVNVYRVHDDRPVDLPALRAAVAEVVARHDVLRTSVHLSGFSVPLQLVHAQVEIPTALRDLSHLGEDAQRQDMTAFVAAERADAFDLSASRPLLRVFAHQLGGESWLCTFTQSHAIMDGWSNQLFLVDLVDCYKRIRDGLEPEPYDAPRVRFADTIAAELDALDSVEDRAYWQGLVEDHAKLVLPAAWRGDLDRPAETVRAGVRFADLEQGLTALARTAGVSLKSVMTAAHVKVMSQLTDEPAFHTGLVTHCRPEAAGAERLYGTFLNTLPFPADRTARTWRDLVRQVSDREIEAWPHRHFPMPEIRHTGGQRLIDVFFGYLDFHAMDSDVAEDGWGFNDAPNEFALAITSLSGVLSLRSTSHTLSQEHADRIAAMFRAVLEAMAADADGDARQVQLPQGERELLLAAGASVASAAAVSRCVHELFEERVAAAPDAVAVVAGGQELTYAEVNRRANRLAHHLRSLGMGAESLVGVCLERGAELIPALLGVLKSGAGYVPLNPANPAERLGYVLADAGVEVTVTSAELEGLLQESGFSGHVVAVDRTGLEACPEANPEVVSGPDNAVYVIYTSGSTGRPKGVTLTHANVVRLMETGRDSYGLTEDDTWTLFHSYAFDFSVWEMWGALLHGGRLVVVGQDVARSPEDFLDLLVEQRVTVLSQTPTAFRALVAAAGDGDPRIGRLALRLVVFGGEALEVSELRPWTDRLGLDAPALVNMYGITETTVHVTHHRITQDDATARGTSPVGEAIDGWYVHLLDPNGHLVPIGVPGEIHVGGSGVARGYLGRPGLTAERFVPDPFGPAGARLYRSGDLARRRPDGALDYLGRIDHQVKIRGYRVELGEIEAALSAHADVREAVVVVREDIPGDKQLVAYVIAADPGTPPTGAGLAGHCAADLPAYMVPSAFVELAAVPLTANGKLDRAALPVPGEDAFARAEFVAPRTVVEERVAAVWGRVLGVERVGVVDSFFDLGGDSIRAVALIGALRAEGLDVSVRDVFQRRTVAGLAESLTGRAVLSAEDEVFAEPFVLVPEEDRERLPEGLSDAYPLSRIQTGMLVETLADTEHNRYHASTSYFIEDDVPFTEPALRRAAEGIVARQDVLRTSVDLGSYSVPMQLVHERVDLPLAVHDLRGLDESGRRGALTAYVSTERSTVFDIAVAPLVRMTVHVEDNGWRLSFTSSHAVIEGWSLRSFMTELLADYRRIRDGLEPEPYDVPRVRFADSIAAELGALASEEDRAYWRAVVEDHAPLPVPSAWADPDVTGEDFTVPVPVHDLEARLRALAARSHASPKSVLLAAYVKVMSQLTDEARFHTGLVCHVRPEVLGSDRVFGTYVNTLPFPVDRTARTWRELVRQVFDREAGLWPHRHFPMPEIQREAGTEGRLIDTLFSYLDFPEIEDRAVDARTGLGEGATEFALAVTATISMGLNLKTNTRTMSRADAERVAGMLRTVLEAMAADADGDARAVYLPEGERASLLDAGASEPFGAATHCLHELFEQQVAAAPEAVALIAGGEELTYAEVNRRANRIAHQLRATGVGPESLVGVCLERGADLMPSLLGVIKSGAGYVPLDPANPADRLRHVIADAGVRTVVTDTGRAPLVEDAVPGGLLVLDRDQEMLAERPETNPDRLGDPDNTLYVIYTSGTTGRPKGVCLTHANALRLFPAMRRRIPFDASDVWALFHSYAFDVSVFEMWGALLHGGTLVVVPQDVARSPEDFLDLLVEHRVTMLAETPSAFRPLVDLAAQGDPRIGRLSLRMVMNGGEPLEMADLRPWTDRLGLERPVLVNAHGITETTVIDTFHAVGPGDGEAGTLIPIGRPLDDVSVHLLDRHGNLVPYGVPGEMCIGGPAVARGYLGRPALTAERFVPDPYGPPGTRLYRTGDLARRRPDGELEFLGRADDQVKVRGYRVELGEIETVVAQHPQVRDAVVMVREDRPGERQLVAYCIAEPSAGALPASAELAGHCGTVLPEYMVPSAFVALDALPLTVNGKLDRRALPAPTQGAVAREDFAAPRTAVEERVAAIWAEVLGVDRVGIHDGFFAIGGDSIRGVGLVGALRAAGFEVSVRDLFQHRTVAGLCEGLGDTGAPEDQEPDVTVVTSVAPFALITDEDRRALPDGLDDAYPLLRNQTGMLVETLSGGGENKYHNVAAVLVPDDRPFDADALRRAVRTVAARHDVLRTSTDLTSYSVPMQLVWTDVEIPFDWRDLSGLDEEEQRREVTGFVAAEQADPFDLTSDAPLMRVFAHVRSADAWFLTLTQSHAILEGWSHQLLVKELVGCYRRIRDGLEPEPYRAPGVRFADSVAAEVASLGSDEDRAYWKGVVDGHAKLALPAAWADDNGKATEAYGIKVPLDERRAALRTLADSEGASVKSVLLAAHLKVMGQLTDEPAYHTGVVSHARPEVEGADRVYGLYVNTLPFPADRTARTWRELVRQVADREIELWEHRYFPMPEIQRESRVSGRLIDVMFNYVDFDPDRGRARAGGDGAGARPEALETVVSSAATEFGLSVNAHGDAYLNLRTSTAVMSRADAERVAGMFAAVLDAMAADADGDARAMYLPQGERDMLLGSGSADSFENVSRCLHEIFEEQAAADPDAVAVVSEGQELTYGEVNRRANRLAHHLRSLGVGAESLVGVCLERGPELVPALLGILKAGAGYLPLSLVNPAERLGYILSDSGASVVVTTEDQTELLAGIHRGGLVVLDRDTELLAAQPDTDPKSVTVPDNVIYAMYTSGSTGRPKGVTLSHANVVRLMDVVQEHFALDESDTLVLFHTYAFDISVFELWGALLNGGRLVVAADAVTRSPEEFLDLLIEHEVTVVCQTPTAFLPLAAADEARLRTLSLRAVILAGEQLHVPALRPWTSRLGLGRTALVNMYGPTEAAVYAAYHRLTKRDLKPGAPGSIGRPLSDTRFHLVDDLGHLVPVGVPGELQIAGPGLARGYLGRPALTAERFVPNPYGPPGSRLYRSGDSARRLADGTVEFLGRQDDQIKLRGFRIELGEIQAQVAEHPGVGEAAVLLREDVPGSPQLVAYVTAAGESAPDAAELRAHLSRSLPDYMVPSAFVALDSLPVNASSKLDKQALPAPGQDALASAAYVAPRTPMEQRVASVWADVLAIGRVGAHDSFFDLGGDSIRAVALIGALRSAGLDAAMRDVFERRTLAELAACLGEREGLTVQDVAVAPFVQLTDEDRAKLPDGLVDAYPLTQNQTGMLVEMLAGAGPRKYHLVNSVRFRDGHPFDADALQRAVDLLVDRHEALRTSVDVETYSAPLQLVHARAQLPVRVVDIQDLDRDAQDETVKRYVHSESEAVLAHDRAPLLRICVHQCAEDSWQFTITESHVILDGWSLDVLLGQLLDAYHRFRDGREPEPYDTPDVRFADAVAAETRALASPESRDFWRDVVQRHEKFVLPGTWGDGPQSPLRPYTLKVPFDDLKGRLQNLATDAGVSVKSVLLAAFLKVMGSLTEERAFFTGLTSHVRPEARGADQVCGMHLNTLPFPADDTAGTWRELVRQVFDREAATWAHRHFPMPAVQREWGEADRLIEVYFSHQDFDEADAELADTSAEAGFAVNEFPFSVASGPAWLNLRTNTHAVSPANAERIAAMLRAALEAMAGDPDGDARTALLPEAERELLLGGWAAHPAEPVRRSVIAEFEEQAARTPDAVAVAADGGHVPYEELDARANRLARRLRALGAGPESVVGVLLEPGTDLIVTLLGVWKAGAAYLPLDPAHPQDRIGYMLADAGAGLAVTLSSYEDRFGDLFGGRLLLLDQEEHTVAAESAEPLGIAGDLDALAYVIYTSGSTGRPKGVLVPHRGLANHLRWAVGELADRGSGGAPVFSSVAFDLVVPNLWAPLLAGQTVHVLPRDLDRLGELLVASGPYSFIKLTPAHLDVLVHQLTAEEADGLAEVLVVAGEAFTRRTAEAWRALAPRTALINEYGPTEASVGTCTFPVTQPPATDVLPIGRPLPNMTMYVLDARLQPVPTGVAGELYVGGAGVVRGYAGRPGLTAERFLPDPHGAPGARLYRTGDLVRMLPDGNVAFLGRIDRQLKVRGYRVEPGEIEAALTGLAPVADARVVTREDTPGDVRLVAYLVPTAEGAALPDAQDLRSELALTLPDYLVPSAFVALERMPLNANGKLDERALPAPEADLSTAVHIPPRTATEVALAGIWATLLGIERVGTGDSFFSLGGHSILVIRQVAEARRAGLPLTLFMVYQHLTLGELAAAVDAAAPRPQAPAATAPALPSPLRVMAETGVPGASVARLEGGELVAAEGFGSLAGGAAPVTPDTVFQVGSMSKHITALGVLRLVDQGVLDLDEDVNRYLAGWRVPGDDATPTTLRHLLSMRAGLAPAPGKGYRPGSVPALDDLLHGRPPAVNEPVAAEGTPGEAFRKANVHYWVVQRVIADVTGDPFAEVLRDVLLKPLGMADSSFDQAFPERSGRPVALGHGPEGKPLDGGWLIRPDMAAAGLWTTAADIAKAALEVRRSALGRPMALLSQERVTELLTPYPDSFYGLGTVVDRTGADPQFGHGGEPVGYHALFTCALRSGTGWVVLTNSSAGERVIRTFVSATASGEDPGDQGL